jgi:site-specific DNA-methyltransferase (adenine-specific)
MSGRGQCDGAFFYGDNLDVLPRYVADESVDLVYCDPPFSASKSHNLLFRDGDGSFSAAQSKALRDSWTWNDAAARCFRRAVERGGAVSEALQALRLVLGESSVLAYVSMLAPRLVEIRRVMKPTASIFLHCAPAVSHYLRVLMDAVFRRANFRNEIVWRYRRWPAAARQFQRMHDVLLFYSKSDSRLRPFNPLHGVERLAPSTLKTFGTKRQRADHSSGRRRPRLDDVESKGPPLSDVWDIGLLSPRGRERLGYPTQKPEKLLERVLLASSDEENVVLDPFCGGGTTLVAAQRLRRRWIGIDIAHAAVVVARRRMKAACGVDVEVTRGAPASLADASALAQRDPYELQRWALCLVSAQPVASSRGPDRGIDGRAYFHDDVLGSARTKQVLFSVKGGRTGVNDVRDPRGVIERERADIGVLITLRAPTSAMRTEAVDAGMYRPAGGGPALPRLQLITIADLLEGRGPALPSLTP